MNTPMTMLEKPMSSDVRAPLTTSVQHVALEAAGLAERVLRGDGGRPGRSTISSGFGMSVKSNGMQERADDRDRDQHREDPEADQRQPVLAELAPRELPLAERLEADLVVDAGLASGRIDDLGASGTGPRLRSTWSGPSSDLST